MRFILVLILVILAVGSEASGAVRFVGYNTTDCPISGGVVRFNKTAEPQKCFSFTNPVYGQEPCVSYFVVREASNTPSFDVYNDVSCTSFRETVTFDSLCVNDIEGVPSTCSGAGAFQLEIFPGEACTSDCIEPATSNSARAVPFGMLFAIIMGFAFMIGSSFL